MNDIEFLQELIDSLKQALTNITTSIASDPHSIDVVKVSKADFSATYSGMQGKRDIQEDIIKYERMIISLDPSNPRACGGFSC